VKPLRTPGSHPVIFKEQQIVVPWFDLARYTIMSGIRILMLCAAVFQVPAGIAAQTLPPDVQSIIDQYKGQLYFAAKSLKGGETLNYRADSKVQTASVIKLPILAALFDQASEHRFALEDLISCTEANRVQGSGILQSLGTGMQLTVRDAAVLMIIVSDNTATNMLIDKVGVAPVNAYMRKIGLQETTLFKKVFRPATGPLPEEQKKWGLGVTTPAEMMLLLEKIYRKEILDPGSCDEIISILKQQTDRAQISRYLVGPAWEKVQVADKTGALDRVRNDVGIVFTPAGDYILSLFAQESEDQKWTVDNEATLTLAKLSLAILTHLRAGRN
jgi:beta-lactamase class A